MVALTAEGMMRALETRLAKEQERLDEERFDRIHDNLIRLHEHCICLFKEHFEAVDQEFERIKCSRPDHGYYYRFVSEESVDPSFREEAEQAFEIATAELDLTDLPLKIRWFDNFADQDQLRQDFRAGDLDIFSERKGLRGFVSWTSVLEHGSVNLASQWHNSPAARVVAHELKHVQQRREHGSNEVPMAGNGERELDADNYAADFWERHKAKFRPWLA
jgi:hypothetical protein